MSALARLTGVVTNVGLPRSGTNAANNPWNSTEVTVLVGGQSTVEFSYDHTKTDRSGELIRFETLTPIDVLVEVGTYRNEPSFRYSAPWDELKSDTVITALAAA